MMRADLDLPARRSAPSRRVGRRQPTGDDLFDLFWSCACRPEDKAVARRAFAKALKATGGDPEPILRSWAEHNKRWSTWADSERTYIPLPATWLNKERWENPLPPWDKGKRTDPWRELAERDRATLRQEQQWQQENPANRTLLALMPNNTTIEGELA